jgi:hypothetical protein
MDAAGATICATDWATHFYADLLSVENCEFWHRPIRFWLVSFIRSDGNEKVYGIVLPNGTIVEPHTFILPPETHESLLGETRKEILRQFPAKDPVYELK